MKDIFEEKNIAPMLIGESGKPFDSPEYLYELKWDGERCLAFLDPQGGTELRNKRNIKMLPKVPELSQLHKLAKGKCILDGELLILRDGKPDFSAIQRRSLMTDTFKIQLDMKQNPASFVAFDILYWDGENQMLSPLTQRRRYLERAVKESERLAVSRYIEDKGAAFYRKVEQRGLEGIVAKRKDSIYIPGKRTRDWIKIKNLLDDDFVVCGYIFKENRMISLILGQYRDGSLIEKAHVTLGVGGKPFEQIQAQKKTKPLFPGERNRGAVWIEPSLVCTVSFMERTKNGGMRQPVFKGLRDDKLPQACMETP